MTDGARSGPTDVELLVRALSVKRGASHGPNYRLRRLISKVDEYDGEPTDEVVTALAWEYRETRSFVRLLFETRKDRARQREWKTKRKRLIEWLPIEDAVIRELVANRNGRSLDELERAMAEALTALPENRMRGVKRTVAAVHYRRIELQRTIRAEEMCAGQEC